jgi:cytoskeletal protein CcmA (bactofilin family)
MAAVTSSESRLGYCLKRALAVRPCYTSARDWSGAGAPEGKMVSLDSSSPAPGAAAGGLSLILGNMAVEGSFRSKNDLHVDGTVKGDVTVRNLTIGESGFVDGIIAAEFVQIYGRVAGSVTAKRVQLYASAHVLGDICHEQLIMESGADFQGRSFREDPTGGANMERTKGVPQRRLGLSIALGEPVSKP